MINSYSKMIKYSSIQGFANNIKQSSTSKPARICSCNSSKHAVCGSQSETKRVEKDNKFAVYVSAVDQLNHTVNASIHIVM
jgi:hypothetical protein